MSAKLQTEILRTSRGRVMAMDSAYHVAAENRGADVVVNASYCGVLPARFIARNHPRGAIGVDCAIGPAGASIAGLWYLEALNIPAAVADVRGVILGNGIDLYSNGIVSHANRPAMDCGAFPGMKVSAAAQAMLERDPASPDAEDVTNRSEQYRTPDGRMVICVDSIAFGRPEDRSNVLVTAGHAGRSALPYFLKVRPYGFICSDGGMGRDRSGVCGMVAAGEAGIPGATVDARTACMGSGLSTLRDGVISASNCLGERCGISIGMSAWDAARALVEMTWAAPGPD